MKQNTYPDELNTTLAPNLSNKFDKNREYLAKLQFGLDIDKEGRAELKFRNSNYPSWNQKSNQNSEEKKRIKEEMIGLKNKEENIFLDKVKNFLDRPEIKRAMTEYLQNYVNKNEKKGATREESIRMNHELAMNAFNKLISQEIIIKVLINNDYPNEDIRSRDLMYALGARTPEEKIKEQVNQIKNHTQKLATDAGRYLENFKPKEWINKLPWFKKKKEKKELDMNTEVKEVVITAYEVTKNTADVMPEKTEAKNLAKVAKNIKAVGAIYLKKFGTLIQNKAIESGRKILGEGKEEIGGLYLIKKGDRDSISGKDVVLDEKYYATFNRMDRLIESANNIINTVQKKNEIQSIENRIKEKA